MKKAIKYIYDANPIYVHFKKHYCPQCEKRLELGFISVVVNSKSQEAKNYDFSVGDTFFVGDVEFRTRCFYCSSCDVSYSFGEIKKHEREHKNNF